MSEIIKHLMEEIVGYLESKFSLGKKPIQCALIGILALIVAVIGIYLSEDIVTDKYTNPYSEYFKGHITSTELHPYSYLNTPSCLLLLAGIILIAPVIVKLALRLIMRLWKIVKLVIYEVIYEGTKAIEDAKKKGRTKE